jgi:hypothetical protein
MFEYLKGSLDRAPLIASMAKPVAVFFTWTFRLMELRKNHITIREKQEMSC